MLKWNNKLVNNKFNLTVSFTWYIKPVTDFITAWENAIKN